MKKTLLVLLLVSVFFAGCTINYMLPTADTASPNTVSYTPGVQSNAPQTSPSIEPSSQLDPSVYGIEKGYIIVYVPDGTVVYDITYDYPNRWEYWISNLAVEPEALYFTEGGYHLDSDPEVDGEYALVRINSDGSARVVLHTMNAVDYLQIVPFKDKVFFVADGFDSVAIGWANSDGSGSGWLDLSDYAANYGAYADWLGSAYLYTSGNSLHADIQIGGDDFTAEHTISIGADLSVQHVSG